MKKSTFILLFIGFFLLQCSTVCVNIVFLKDFLGLFKLLGIVILTVSSLLNFYDLKLKKKNFFIIIILFILGIISYLSSSNFMILAIVLLIFSCINQDFKEILKIDLIIKLCLLLIVVLSYLFGFTEQLLVTRESFIRNSFGFFHPNVFAMYLTIILMEYSYLRKKENLLPVYLLALLLGIFIFFLVDSRTSEICLIVFCLMLFVEKKLICSQKQHKLLGFMEKNLYIILFILSMVATIMFINGVPFIYKVDGMLSGRIWLQSLIYNKYQITLFGNTVDFFSTLDNIYIRTVLVFGIFGVIMLYVVNKKNIELAIRKKDFIYLAIILTMLFYGLMEHISQDICFSPFILYFCQQLVERGKQNED